MRAQSHIMFGDVRRARAHFDAAAAVISEQCTGMGEDHRFVRLMLASLDVKLGELGRARALADALLLDAVERGDPVAERGVCVSALVPLSLAADDVDRARQLMTRAADEDRCAVIMFAGEAEAAIALYDGRPRDAVDAWRSRWRQIKAEKLLMPPYFRLTIVRSLASALVSAPEGRGDLRQAAGLARLVRSYRFPLAAAVRAGLRAALALHAGRPDRAAELYEQATEHYEQAGLALDAQACRYRQGQIVGGEDGHRRSIAAAGELRAIGVACPERWVAMVVPEVTIDRSARPRAALAPQS
jgi:hypothetical protein